jgi:hypothetical protein
VDSHLVTLLELDDDFDFELLTPTTSPQLGSLPFDPTHKIYFGSNSGIQYLTQTERTIAKTFRTDASNYYIQFGSLPYTSPSLNIRQDFALTISSHPLARIHFEVIKSGKHNYEGCRIPLPHNKLNIPAMHQMIVSSNFPDRILADFSEFGWPSGCINSVIPKGSIKGNHASIRAQEVFFTKWIEKNLKNGTLAGPFSSNPLCTEISLVATGAVPKDIPGDFRIIHDLSFPSEDCLNFAVPRHTYLGKCFVLALGKVDEVAQEIFRLRSLGHKVRLWGRDLKSCFRQVMECPSSWQYQGFCGPDNSIFFDLTALMGSVPSAMKAMRLGSLPVHAHIQEGHFMILYIDDFTGVDIEEEAEASAASFDEKLWCLNLMQNVAKIEAPTPVKKVLGVEVDCDNMILRLDSLKIQEIQKLLNSWSVVRDSATLTELRSLAGKLLNVCKVVPQSRPFISRILEKIRCPRGTEGSYIIRLDNELQKDVNWWKLFLPSCNGIRIIRSLDCGPTDGDLSMDASPEGAGAVFLSAGVYMHCPFPVWIKDLLRNSRGVPCMNSLELLTVLLVMRLWGPMMSGRCFAFWTDNLATVSSLHSGRSQATFRQKVLREIAMESSKFDIHIRPRHISSSENRMADCLSRIPQSPVNLNMFLSIAEGLGFVNLKNCVINPDIFQFSEIL